MELNALDFEASATATAEELAVSAARDGDVVYFPGGIKEYQAPAGGLRITKSIEVFGDGPSLPGGNLAGTTFVPGGTGSGFDVLVIEPPSSADLERVRLRDFKIKDIFNGPTGDAGIRCRTAHTRNVRALQMERVNVLNMSGTGIIVEGVDPQPGGGVVENFLMITCFSSICAGGGILFRNIPRAVAVQCGANHSLVDGWLVDRCAVAMYQPTVDSNAEGYRAHMTLQSCRVAIVDSAHFESFGVTHTEGCLIAGGDGGGPTWFGAGRFIGASKPNVAGLREAISAEGPIFVGPNHFFRMDELVNLQVAAGCTVLPQMYTTADDGGIGNVVVTPGARVSATSVNRVVDASAPPGVFYSGLTVPSKSDGDPTWAVQNGMLYYDSAGNRLRVRIANAWATVLVD